MRRIAIRFVVSSLVLCVFPALAGTPSRQESVLAESQSLPSAEELADRSAQASGGREAWAKLSTLVLKGDIEMPALHLTGHVELYEKAPNKSLRVVSVAESSYVLKHGFDGQMGWELDPQKGLRRLQATELDEARVEAIFDSEVRLKEIYPDMKVVGKSRVGDRDAYVALMRTRPSAKPARFYFDAQSGLRIAEQSDVLASNGQIEKTTTFYEDYRTVAGVQIPFRIRFTSPSANFTINLNEVHPNEAVDDSVFAIPSDPQGTAAAVADDAAESLDEGETDGNLYKNRFFGLEYRFPLGWTPHGEETKKHIMAVGRNAVSGDTALEKGAYQEAEKRTEILLSVFQYPLGTPVDYNDAIQVMAEDVAFAPGIKTGREYLQLMGNNLKRSSVPLEMQGEPLPMSLAGLTFYRQDALLTVRTKTVYEAIVATITRQHSLVFVFVAGSDDDRNALVKTLQTIRLSQPVQAGR